MFRPAVYLSFLAALVFSLTSQAAEPTLISETASERGTAGIGNKIVTLDGKTHVVWQASTSAGYRSFAQTWDRASGKWSDAVELGPGVDNHARPVMTADRDGYLHVIIGGHNTPLGYRRSVKPNDISAWTKLEKFGRGTYPSLVCGADNTLVLSVRPAGSGNGRTGVDLYVKQPGTESWKHRPLILEREPKYRGGYAGYNSALAWGPDGKQLHFAADVYEGPGVYKDRGLHQAVLYMVSADYGTTWQRSDGTMIEGETYTPNLDPIEVNLNPRAQTMPKPMLRLGGLMVNRSGQPFVLYTQHEPKPGRAHLVTPDGAGGWTQLPLAAALDKGMPGYGALGARGGMSITTDGRIQMLLPMAPLEDFGVPGAPRIKPETVRYLFVETADLGQTYQFSEPIPHDPAVAYHVPTLEKPTGHNLIGQDRNAALMVIQGLHRYPRRGEVIQNRLYFVQP